MGRENINTALATLDETLKIQQPIINTHSAISDRHGEMLGDQLKRLELVGHRKNPLATATQAC